ncbi:ATP-binding protein [Catellatospora sp. NPDC049609]|uniref:ATP-binding protein n=1 Tax=Catellatospora sp. NPDC049609 TaxID=3155505 RepID=UPI00342E82C7
MDEVTFDAAGDLARVRAFVRAWAVEAGLVPARADLLMLAVSELMSNTLEHTGGGGVVRLWAEGGSLVCEVADARPAGSRRAGAALMPAADAPRGRGLAIVEQVCDEVSLKGDGSAVQLRMNC